ncbi:MAG TPA: SpoIIIAH-like family protein [Firmicutes bacterium]|nr:SpoIIIAH-like family protein [Candidatus Fermentithermobacillaceae bacterium]
MKATSLSFRKDGTKQGERTQRRFPLRRLWKLAVFLIVVGMLAYYATVHWPEISAVFSLDEGVPTTAAPPAGEDFFIEFRLDREKMEKEQLDLVKQVMDDKTASKEARDAAHAQYLQIVDTMGKELKIEGILKAKNMESLVFLSGDSCTVVVRKASLDAKDVAAIADTVRRIAKVKPENVTVIPTDR